uniref:Uncharacterized protein n=1 Tax=Aegilops tauschii subsp. strangulata TaxID=200361 RepID=A0A453A761_AEGTS
MKLSHWICQNLSETKHIFRPLLSFSNIQRSMYCNI